MIGVLNVQFAFKGERLYVLEANPRASRSVPFVEKVTGLPVAKAAALLMTGSTLAGLGLQAAGPVHVGVKEAVLPFARFPGADSLLGPEMRSTGEVLGLDARFEAAFAKSQEAALRGPAAQGGGLPVGPQRRQAGHRAAGQAPRRPRLHPGRDHRHGRGPAPQRVQADVVRKGHGSPGNVVDRIGPGRPGRQHPRRAGGREDGYDIRIAAVAADIPCITTLSGLTAVSRPRPPGRRPGRPPPPGLA